ncbi:MAG TPA: hypothetical protein VGD40_08390 [Chryseosolibacter sp.]
MKADRKIYKGIEYVLVTELPKTQREQLFKTLTRDQLIKILIDGVVVPQCLQYKDYSLWFDNVFKAQQSVPQEAAETIEVSSSSFVLKA